MISCDFDDVLLVPSDYSEVCSRDLVDLSFNKYALSLNFPIIASPMKGITSADLVNKLGDLGGIGILPRFYEDSLLKVIKKEITTKNFGVAIGLGDEYEQYLDMGCTILCLDVANGYLSSVLKKCEEISTHLDIYNYQCLLMSGNVVTQPGAKNLYDAGVDLIRIGIGSGGLCTTRNYTGVGLPQLSAINECKNIGIPVADGGIRNSGDAVKALAMGAELLMIGSLFGKTFESSHNGVIYGMASRRLQEEYYHSVKSVEGLERLENKTSSVEDFITEFTYGIKSACTYMNAKNLTELRINARWMQVGRNTLKSI